MCATLLAVSLQFVCLSEYSAGSDEKLVAQVEEAVAKLGGKVRRVQNASAETALEIDLATSKLTDDDLPGVFPDRVKIRSARLSRTKVTDRVFEHLKRHPELESLDLASTRVTDEGAVSLAELRGLRELSLRRTAVTDA